MFSPAPNARGSLKPGTLYAIAGEDDWIYYGQVDQGKKIGFFRFRSKQLVLNEEILTNTVMSRVNVVYSSIGSALRKGSWKLLGIGAIHKELLHSLSVVQWPVGTLTVTIWTDGKKSGETRVEDPKIQDFEIIAGWDAFYHIPGRLRVDFEGDDSNTMIGGPIRRERRLKEESARRAPNMPYHQLPPDWVPCR
ncbi:hypothetical protein [Sapientia aquatica]|uniref:Uncharacterized protein n=1 Tax=Sapientia aquatica TaxID=1549640 RepID=A0A4R5W1A7_9BURK|nr:hypothetical protein [Sapientia aquatica]TDK65961.1 hypothetical protein E2I14_10220 [Sapientia aquatica]